MSKRRPTPPPSQPSSTYVDRKTEPGTPALPDRSQSTVPSLRPETQPEAGGFSVIQEHPELARRLGNRSPEEIYGEPSEAERSESRSMTRASEDLALSSTGTQAAAKAPRAQAEPSDPGAPEVDSDSEPRSADATHAGPPLKVDIISGPDEGKSKRFVGVRMVVGRVKGCELVLNDPSVSRRHLELVLGEAGVLLRDLGSGNGVKVNGERATEQLVEHGDVIALGQTKLRFLDEAEQHRRDREAAEKAAESSNVAAAEPSPSKAVEGGAPVGPSPAPQAAGSGRMGPVVALWSQGKQRFLALPKRRKQLLAGGGALLFLLLAVGVSALLFGRSKTAPPALDGHALGLQKLDAAQAALKAGNIVESQALLAAAQKADATINGHALEARLLVDRKAKVSLDQAEGWIKMNRFDDARAELARTPEGDEAFTRRHRELAASVDSAEQVYLLRSFEDALARQDFDAAQRAVDALPKELQADPRGRLARERRRAAEQHSEQRRQAELDRHKQHDLKREHRKQFIAEAFATVSHRLDEQDFPRAALECDRVEEQGRGDAELAEKAVRVKAQIPILARNLKDGQQKLDAHSLEGAVKPLRLAHDIYYSYMGLSGELGQRLDAMLATALLGAGKAQLALERWALAASDLREAVKLAPGTEQAQAASQVLDGLAAQAAHLFDEATQFKERDVHQARVKFRQVVEMTSPSSSLHAKARRSLAALGR